MTRVDTAWTRLNKIKYNSIYDCLMNEYDCFHPNPHTHPNCGFLVTPLLVPIVCYSRYIHIWIILIQGVWHGYSCYVLTFPSFHFYLSNHGGGNRLDPWLEPLPAVGQAAKCAQKQTHILLTRAPSRAPHIHSGWPYRALNHFCD